MVCGICDCSDAEACTIFGLLTGSRSVGSLFTLERLSSAGLWSRSIASEEPKVARESFKESRIVFGSSVNLLKKSGDSTSCVGLAGRVGG